MKKRMLSLVLALVLLVTILPMPTRAATELYIPVIEQAIDDTLATIGYEDLLGVWDYGYLCDLDSDGVQELLVTYQYEFSSDELPDMYPFWYVYSIYDIENGMVKTIAEKELIAGVAGGSYGYAGIVTYKGSPMVMTYAEDGETSWGPDDKYPNWECEVTLYDSVNFEPAHTIGIRTTNTELFYSIDGVEVTAAAFAQEMSDYTYLELVKENELAYTNDRMTLTELRNYVKSLPVPEDKPSQGGFNDVFSNEYYYTPVMWAVENGITTGMTETTFAPNGTCTRAQIVTFLWRANGSPAPAAQTNPFTDVPAGQWYTDAVLWAVENGITTGTSATTFSPDAGCTRGQVATFLWRSQTMPASVNPVNSFVDIDPAAYYYNAVLWAVENGITNGTSAATFAPDATCTRGQIVTFLYRNDAVQQHINRYTYHCEDVSWTEANERAKALGGHLVHLDSIGEMGYLMARIYEMDYESSCYILLGGRRDLDTAEYYWRDTDGNKVGGSLNEESSWENALWLMGEPSLGYAGEWEDVMSMQYSDKDGRWGWNDVPDDLPDTILKNDPSKLGTIVYIVEYDD